MNLNDTYALTYILISLGALALGATHTPLTLTRIQEPPSSALFISNILDQHKELLVFLTRWNLVARFLLLPSAASLSSCFQKMLSQ